MMKSIKIIGLVITVLVTIVATNASTKTQFSTIELGCNVNNDQEQIINMFVSHGHCSLPFSGGVHQLEVIFPERTDQGNPIENMSISFEIDPQTFNVCKGADLTSIVRTEGLFMDVDYQKIKFRSTEVYTMGLNWYQVNGKLTIKGVEKAMRFFATGIRGAEDIMSKLLILEGRIDLNNWGIDYDQIVNGQSSDSPTKWMHLNMTIAV